MLDSNAFGRQATLKVAFLKSWIQDARSAGFEIWLPEPVLWELAAHVADAVEEMRVGLSSKVKLVQQAGLESPAVPDYGDRETIIDRVIVQVDEIEEGLEIIRCPGDEALEAIRDQITQRAPGGTEKGVRTGAADSAWLRAIRAYSGGASETYVIVSSDSDVEKAFRRWDEMPPVIFKNSVEAREQLFLYGLAPHEAATQSLRFLASAIADGSLREVLKLETVEKVDTLLEKLGLDELDVLAVATDIAEIKGVAGVGRVRAQRDQESILLWADLIMDLWITLIERNKDEETTPDTYIVDNAIVRVPVLLRMRDGEVSSAELAEPPWTLFTYDSWDDAEEGMDDCLQSISHVPELSQQELSYSPVQDWEWSADLADGRVVQVNGSVVPGQGWDMHVTVGSESLVLRCARDESRAMPPWVVDVEGDSRIPDRPAWAIGEFVTRKKLG